jgi:catechol 2,3-dioxygenase-like lactoylglutathione lyase family enzyme
MTELIEQLLARFESGRLSRRGLVRALAGLAGGGAEAARADAFRPRSINHVTMSVSDIERSRAFYQSLLQARVIGRTAGECDLDVGGGFLALMKLDRPAGIDHFCIGIEGYEAGRVASALREKGHEPRIYTQALGVKFRVPQVYVRDPDGIQVQFSAAEYRGEMPPPKEQR